MFADALELGCNYVRLAHYPHSEQRRSLMNWVFCFGRSSLLLTVDFANPETYQDAENQLQLIGRDFNRA